MTRPCRRPLRDWLAATALAAATALLTLHTLPGPAAPAASATPVMRAQATVAADPAVVEVGQPFTLRIEVRSVDAPVGDLRILTGDWREHVVEDHNDSCHAVGETDSCGPVAAGTTTVITVQAHATSIGQIEPTFRFFGASDAGTASETALVVGEVRPLAVSVRLAVVG